MPLGLADPHAYQTPEASSYTSLSYRRFAMGVQIVGTTMDAFYATAVVMSLKHETRTMSATDYE